MPELPEVESIRRQLEPELIGRRVTSLDHEPQRRFLDLHLLVGRSILGVGRRGKYLLCPLDQHRELVVHLGMTGSLRFAAAEDHTRARLQLDDGRTLIYRDPRRFGRLAVVAAGDHSAIPTLARLGPEPLTDGFDRDRFAAALAATRAPVKAALLAQRLVAGIGNIYADEALWTARIHPGSRRVGRGRARELHRAIREVLTQAVEREGTTFRDYRMVNGQSGRNADFLQAYGRAGSPCRRCGAPLRRVVIAQRGTTYCPACQRR
ncbi:MAG TPA: bifunctional DNA-formamidopyrimidine glycosylase/DNA-(apurinic or apyrimidinic site) lyase [Nitriliruptorales bacterium]|nr:bifunctional DNA-formamidopyrimidine glycosylase/DNA-(apurinic or apyrimidinic site) lyase [Nitriliruptorales bacterium]